MKYRIELEEDQIRLVAKCLELASRMYCGQLDMRTLFPLDDEAYKKQRSLDDDAYFIKKGKVDISLQEIKNVIWTDLVPGGHYGINYDPKSDHLYDMYKEILHTFEKLKMEEKGDDYRSNVHTSQPWSHTDNPRIKVYPLTTELLRDENIDNILSSE